MGGRLAGAAWCGCTRGYRGTGNGTGSGKIGAGAIGVDALQSNFLHLADGPAVLGRDLALVDFADDEGVGGNAC